MSKLEIRGPMKKGYDTILTPEAQAFVADLVTSFAGRIDALLKEREQVQAGFDRGERPDFLEASAEIRQGDWSCAPLPKDLLDRRVEITGPVERKMVINALNSGAKVFMADFEDSNAPTWDNTIEGQINLRDAVRRTITYEHPRKGTYQLDPQVATLMVRPRGLHLKEEHILLDGDAVPGCLVDFGLFFFHNARELMSRGSGPYFYLPKLENHREARLWNDVFVQAQQALDIPKGTIKATVLIETITASFEMDEILYELRDHSAGLNCGRWDYIFSYIKKFRNDPHATMPDRGEVGMTQPFMRAYSQLVIQTCHKRGVHAMGGMAAQIPIKADPQANEQALEKVRADKVREASDGHDGTWVAHPALVPLAMEIFDEHMPESNQIDLKRADVSVCADDLLAVPKGERTEEGLRQNIRVGIQYLEAWLQGIGCVPLYHLMEDAATAEISRTQVWQWLHNKADVGGEPLTVQRFRSTMDDELDRIREVLGAERFDHGAFDQAKSLFDRLVTSDHFEEFLTLSAYQLLLQNEKDERLVTG